MAFMISRETENVRSASEVEDAFRAITEGGKQAFVTEEELYMVWKIFQSSDIGFRTSFGGWSLARKQQK